MPLPVVRLALGSTFAVTATVLVACGGGASGPARTPYQVPGDIMAPMYAEPSPLVAGEYHPVRSGDSALNILEPLGFEPASGDEVNGIRLFDYYDEYARYRDPCGADDYMEFREYQGLEFGYLPPGTLAFGPQAAAVCPDGSISGFGQSFQVTSATFDVWYSVGERALLFSAAVGGKFAGEIAGRPAAVVAETPEGLRHSSIAMATGNGVITLDVHDMPLDDAVKIAEGIRCGEC